MRPRPAAQAGMVLIAVLLAIVLGGAGLMLASGELTTQARIRAQARSTAALAQARTALLGYAISYAEQHPGQGYGYLPCPDTANTGSTPIGACHVRDHGALGRFPYRTLGLPDLRDGWGDCLWFAVAGSVKNNPKALVLNWDSPGQFEIVDDAGHSLASLADRAIAVLIAPGPPRDSQTRTASNTQRCPGSASAAADLSAFLDPPYPDNIAGTQVFTQGLADGLGNNDLLTWITIDELFDGLRRRSDFPLFINGMLDRASTVFGAWSTNPSLLLAQAAQIDGNRLSGRLPDAATLGIAPPFADVHDNWRDQVHFVACADGSACLAADLSDSAHTPLNAAHESCRALLLFGGERIRTGSDTQSRTTAAERADPAQYLEGANRSSIATGSGSFDGYRQFSVPFPSQPATADVLKCIS
ncbi:MAG: hypothetical protein Q7J47_10335 [Azoarcus sp.]|nr:hypothetical protein [Azoarcus sp.]